MEGINKLFMLLLLLFFASYSLCTEDTNLEINSLKREIYLKGKYVRISFDIEIQNTGPRKAKIYSHMVHGNYSKNLFEILAFSKGYIELPISLEKTDSTNSLVYTVELPYFIDVGSKMQIHILELHKDRLSPKPDKIPLGSDEQKVEFIDNLYASSMYHIVSQEVTLALPNINNIEYYTQKNATRISKSHIIHYGPLLGEFKEEELRIHYEHPIPLIFFPNVERQILLSHLGNIAIDEHIELKNDASGLDGEFNRIKYNSLTSHNHAGHIFRKLNTQLPRKAFGLYYTDVIGNVSTSYASREVFTIIIVKCL